MPVHSPVKFFGRLSKDITETTTLPFSVMMRGNIRAAFGFEDETHEHNPKKNARWRNFLLGDLSQVPKNEQTNPEKHRYAFFWAWPYFMIRSLRTTLMWTIDSLASDHTMGLQSESPAWAKGLKAVIASFLYLPEVISYGIAKFPEAVMGHVKGVKSTLAVIATGLAVAAAITTCVVFPPAIPFVILAAEAAVACSFIAAGLSSLYTLGSGIANLGSAVAHKFKTLFSSNSHKAEASHQNSKENPNNQLVHSPAVVSPQVAQIQKAASIGIAVSQHTAANPSSPPQNLFTFAEPESKVLQSDRPNPLVRKKPGSPTIYGVIERIKAGAVTPEKRVCRIPAPAGNRFFPAAQARQAHRSDTSSISSEVSRDPRSATPSF